jgi:putative transposase
MICRYSEYGWSKKSICKKWDMSIKTFYALKNPASEVGTKRRIQVNTITPEERESVREYALSHTELRHREMAFRMIDENVAYLSPSSVYRILRYYRLIPLRRKNLLQKPWDPHQIPEKADKIWQSDLTHLRYHYRSYYLLLFLDTFSRFIVYWRLCLQMTGETVKDAFIEAIQQTGQHPILQTDNGSCYISYEFQNLLSRANIEHHFIHPHCPNENAEIERVNRTLKQDLDLDEVRSFEHLHQIVKERIDHYNYIRYHSAIGYITPHAKYRGDPEQIFEERRRKLEKAKAIRIKQNWMNLQVNNVLAS